MDMIRWIAVAGLTEEYTLLLETILIDVNDNPD